jgi:hypothetical protein
MKGQVSDHTSSCVESRVLAHHRLNSCAAEDRHHLVLLYLDDLPEDGLLELVVVLSGGAAASSRGISIHPVCSV